MCSELKAIAPFLRVAPGCSLVTSNRLGGIAEIYNESSERPIDGYPWAFDAESVIVGHEL